MRAFLSRQPSGLAALSARRDFFSTASARGRADRFARGEGARRLAVEGKLVGEDDCIVERLGRTLPHTRGLRVRRFP